MGYDSGSGSNIANPEKVHQLHRITAFKIWDHILAPVFLKITIFVRF